MTRKNNLTDFSVFLQKLFRKFTTFTKHQKSFVLFLFAFAIVVLLFPILRVSPSESLDAATYSLWIWSFPYFKSLIIMLVALAFLFGRNMNMTFKAFMVKGFGFRETEPILNFLFLWMIVSLYMPLLDTIGVVSKQAGSFQAHRGLWIQLFVLLIGLGIAIVEVRKSANQNTQKTKILNIMDEENSPSREEPKRVVQHLFDDEEFE